MGQGRARRRAQGGMSMYLPAHFAEDRVEVLHGLIREHPLGTLVTLGPDGLAANHIPFEVDPLPAPFGAVRCHVARANPVWRDHPKESDALVIFQGPAAYVSPSWYPTKAETGKVVPTYNYVVVHAHGRLRAVDDPDWLRGLVERLTRRHEAGRPQPWKVDDAPEDYVKSQLRAIVGIEILPSRLVGKWKLSQNRPAADRDGVVRGLDELGSADARDMAERVDRASRDRR
jgi:transcriptional regulator